MNSEKLSARTKQPGHDQTFKKSESFCSSRLAGPCLDPDRYESSRSRKTCETSIPVSDEEKRALGIEPEAKIVHRSTGAASTSR